MGSLGGLSGGQLQQVIGGIGGIGGGGGINLPGLPPGWNPGFPGGNPDCGGGYCPPPPPPAVCHVYKVYYLDCHSDWRHYWHVSHSV